MDESTALGSIREAARRGSEFAKLIGPVVAKAIAPITMDADIPACDLEALCQNYGEITPAMIAAYRGAFEGGSMNDDDLEFYNRVPMRRAGKLVYILVERPRMSRRKQLIIIGACSFSAGFLVTFLVGRFIL